MTDKVRKLLEEFGAAAAEPVHTDEEPKEHTPELSNDDVIDGQHAEEIKELIVESYELLESLGELSDEDFADLIDNASYEDMLIMEQSILAVEANMILNEGIFRGKYGKFIRKEAKRGIAKTKSDYEELVSKLTQKYNKQKEDINKSISKGFLGLGGERARYIKDAASKRREELKASIAKKFETAEKITDPKARLQALLDARKAQDSIKKDAKKMAKQDFKDFEDKQIKKIDKIEAKKADITKAEADKRDKIISDYETSKKDMVQKDWEDTSLAGGIYKFGKKLFKPKAPAPQPAPAATSQPKPAPQPKPQVQTSQPKPAPQPKIEAPKVEQNKPTAIEKVALDALKSVVEKPVAPAKVEAPVETFKNVVPEEKKAESGLDRFNARMQKTKEMKTVSESFTRDELVELFEALELDTHKYTFEYLAEQLGFEKE